MYIFSVSAKARKAMDGIAIGQIVPFIVYINFKDALGAEKLCQLYLLRAGFIDVDIEKRKALDDKLINNAKVVNADKALKEAFDKGYSIQLFDMP